MTFGPDLNNYDNGKNPTGPTYTDSDYEFVLKYLKDRDISVNSDVVLEALKKHGGDIVDTLMEFV